MLYFKAYLKRYLSACCIGFFPALVSALIVSLNKMDEEMYESTSDIFFSRMILHTILWGTVLFFISLKGIKNDVSKEIQDKQERIEEEKRKKEEQENIKYLEFYKKCKKRKIFKCETDKEKNEIELIGKNSGYNNREEAIKAYNLGKTYERKKKEEAREEAREKRKQKELQKYNENKNDSELVMCDKYITKLLSEIDFNKQMIRVYQGSAILNQKLTPTTKSPYISGGIASVVAGGAAGAIVAGQTMHQNELIKQRQQQIREENKKLLSDAQVASSEYERAIKVCAKKIDAVLDRIYDDSKKDEWFKLIEPKVIEYKITEFGNVDLTIESKVLEKIEIVNTYAILDGFLRVNVLNNNKEIVARGFYCAPGEGVHTFKNIGFNSTKKVKVMAIAENEGVEKDAELFFEFKMGNLWIVEGNKSLQ